MKIHDEQSPTFAEANTGTIKDRRLGRTTRQADEDIQRLFKVGKVLVLDHADRISRKATRNLVGIIMRRLQAEHPGLKVSFDKRTFVIEIIK
jgi:hypothetical protein